MHSIENGHHQPGDLAPHMHVIVDALGETDAEALTGLAVALIEQDGGIVSSAAFELLERVRAAEPENLQAGFWYAIALRQQGGIEEARAAFMELRANLPDGLPLATMLEHEIEALNSGP